MWGRRGKVDLDTLRSILHELKCSILFDSILWSYFWPQHQADLLKYAAFNTNHNRVYPKEEDSLKKDWEENFNLLVYSLRDFTIHAAQ